MKKDRSWDFAIYITVGLAVVAGVIWSAYHPAAPGDGNRYTLGVGLMTAFIFAGTLIGSHRKLISIPAFWGLVAVILAGHTILVAALWKLKVELDVRWWGVIFFGELAMSEYLLLRYANSINRSLFVSRLTYKRPDRERPPPPQP